MASRCWMFRLFLALFLLTLPGAALAACTGGLITGCPAAVSLLTGDLLWGHQNSQTPNSRKITVGQILNVTGSTAYFPFTGGTVTGATTFSAASTALTVTNNTSLGGTLAVTGTSTLTGLATFSNGLLLATAKTVAFTDSLGGSATSLGTSGATFAFTSSGAGGGAFNLMTFATRTATPTLAWVTPHSFSTSPAAGAVTPNLRTNINSSGAQTGGVYYTAFTVNTDTADASGATGGGAVGTYVGHTLSAGAKGGRTALFSFLTQAGATTSAPGEFLVAGGFFAESNASMGGTAGIGNARGNVFGSNPSALLKTGSGLYVNAVFGTEVNFGAQTGTGVAYKGGLKVVSWVTDAVKGSIEDYGIGLDSQSGGSIPGVDKGLTFGTVQGWWPITSTGTVIGTYAGSTGGGPAMAAAYGIDFSAVAFSTAFLKSTGFDVNGAGDAKARTVAVGNPSLTLTDGALGFKKITASASAPGATGLKIEAVCGTGAGTLKLIVAAGTSGTAVTIVDNVGSGVTGC